MLLKFLNKRKLSKKAIICLCSKRSGSTAINKVFARHPDVRILHPNQKIHNWEPNFWFYSALYLDRDQPATQKALSNENIDAVLQLKKRLKVFDKKFDCENLTKESIFSIWDQVHEKYGPIIFDKSPNYLDYFPALELLLEYGQSRDNCFSFFALIRDPRDVISSQFQTFREKHPDKLPVERQENWIREYSNLEKFCSIIGSENCPVFKYEEWSSEPAHYIPKILEHVGVRNISRAYKHIRPTSVGRYFQETDPGISNWEFSQALRDTASRYGYKI